MSNPLYALYGNQPLYENGVPQLLEEAIGLRKRIQNPRQEVERLLQSGEMSQQQFNRLAQTANQILGSMR